jgi:hypothetical protein
MGDVTKTVHFRPQSSVLHAKLGGADYVVTGKSSYVKATSVSIIPKRSIEVGVEGQGKLELTLPKGMISGIYSVTAADDKEDNIQFQQHDTPGATVISFDVPSGARSLSIAGATVVPEFPAPLLAIAVASVLYMIASAKSRKF